MEPSSSTCKLSSGKEQGRAVQSSACASAAVPCTASTSIVAAEDSVHPTPSQSVGSLEGFEIGIDSVCFS